MINHSTLIRHILFAVVLCLSFLSVSVYAQTTAFTYQGRLTDNGNPSTGLYDFEFRLFDAVGGGTQKGTTLTLTNVTVTNGTFSVQLEFVGCLDCFDGGARFLEISVRPAGGGTYTELEPRQPLTSSPYAIKALDAAQLGGQPASGFIRNTTMTQSMTNFNIGGTGIAQVFDAATHFSISGLRAFAVNGPAAFGGTPPRIYTASNTFAGDGAGLNTTPDPIPLGSRGTSNSFFGAGAGAANSIGWLNSFFGVEAGLSNTSGNFNSFFGFFTGKSNTSGSGNSFFGRGAGQSNTIGIDNTVIGGGADVSAGNLNNATAIGTRAFVSQSDSLVLGSISGVNGATADTLVGIGTTAPNFKLTVLDSANTGLRVATATTGGTVASFGSNGAFEIDSPGFVGGRLRVAENGLVTIGRESVGGDLIVFGNTLLNTVTIANGATLNVLGAAGSTSLCRNASAQISTCSSSIRYKQNIHAFASGLSLINRLHPVIFNWRTNNEPDLGLVAEEVAKVEPRLVTRNDKGEIEGVKYDRVSVVLINAVKEQQTQIAEIRQKNEALQMQLGMQNEMIEEQRIELEALRSFICSQKPAAEVCNPRP